MHEAIHFKNTKKNSFRLSLQLEYSDTWIFFQVTTNARLRLGVSGFLYSVHMVQARVTIQRGLSEGAPAQEFFVNIVYRKSLLTKIFESPGRILRAGFNAGLGGVSSARIGIREFSRIRIKNSILLQIGRKTGFQPHMLACLDPFGRSFPKPWHV